MLPQHPSQPTQSWALLAQKSAAFCHIHENRVSIWCFSDLESWRYCGKLYQDPIYHTVKLGYLLS